MYIQKDKRFGFTLAELMAVVIIVAILTSLGVGYYKRSVEQSRFSEGLMAASAVAEAVNRWYFDRKMEGSSTSPLPSFEHLDIGLNGVTCSGNSCNTKYFTVTIGNSAVTATRKEGPYRNAYIEVSYHFASNQDRIACGWGDPEGEGKTLCESMGYVVCTDDVCVKS